MRSGFKMRQSASEGGGLVAHPRGGLGLGHEGEAIDESLEDGLAGGRRLVFGNANSSSVNSLATSPGGRAGGYRIIHTVIRNSVYGSPVVVVPTTHGDVRHLFYPAPKSYYTTAKCSWYHTSVWSRNGAGNVAALPGQWSNDQGGNPGVTTCVRLGTDHSNGLVSTAVHDTECRFSLPLTVQFRITPIKAWTMCTRGNAEAAAEGAWVGDAAAGRVQMEALGIRSTGWLWTYGLQP